MKMDEKKTVSWAGLLWFLFIAGLGYFIYGGINGAIAAFLLAFGAGLIAVLGVIPFFGAPLYILVARFVLFKPLLSLTKLSPTFLTSFIFGMNAIYAIILCFMMTVFVLGSLE